MSENIDEKLEFQKNELMKQMEDEITQIKYDIDNSSKTNSKIKRLRALKYSLTSLRAITPYVLTAAMTFGLFASLHVTPFILNDQKKKLEKKKIFDSLGNIRYEEQYDNYDSAKSTISYVDKWKKRDDGFYSRKVLTFSAKDILEDIITRIVNDVDIDSLESVFGEPVSSKIQIHNNLTEEEIQAEPYLEAIIYSRYNDFIVVKESQSENLFSTIVWVILTLFVEIIPFVLRKEYSDFDYIYYIDLIKEKYPYVDAKELEKKLEIKMNNYDRLTR